MFAYSSLTMLSYSHSCMSYRRFVLQLLTIPDTIIYEIQSFFVDYVMNIRKHFFSIKLL